MFSDSAVFTLTETPCSEIQACRFMLTTICAGGGDKKPKKHNNNNDNDKKTRVNYYNMHCCILLQRRKCVSYSKAVRANSGHLCEKS